MAGVTVEPLVPPLDTPAGWGAPDDIVALSETGEIAARHDWLIVGAGITGLAAAHRLAEVAPGDSVLLVDARPVGWGTSGRNSGFLIDLPHKFELDSRDPDFLRRITRLNRATIAWMKQAVVAGGIDCDWSEAGKLQGAVRARGTGMLRGFCEILDLMGEPHEVLDRGACARILGTDYYAAAVATPGSVLLDPFRLVRGLARGVGPNVTLRDNTAVIGFTAGDRGARATLRRSDGSVVQVSARRVILATDPFVPQFGFMADRIVPAMTFASITRRLTPAERARYPGNYDWGLTPADSAGTTLRMTRDGRLLIRNQYAHAPRYRASSHDIARARDIHRSGLDARFPMLADVPIAGTWAGIVSLSGNHATFFGEVSPGIFSANCYNGVGMVRGACSGRLLVDKALGIASQHLDDLTSVSAEPSRLPPEPLLGLGVNGRFRLAGWQSRDEQ